MGRVYLLRSGQDLDAVDQFDFVHGAVVNAMNAINWPWGMDVHTSLENRVG